MHMLRVGKRKDETRSCEKCRHLERGTHVPDGRIPPRERLRWFGHVQGEIKILITDDSRWKAKSR